MSLFNALKKLAGAAVKEGLAQYTSSRQQSAANTQPPANAQPDPNTPLVDLYSFGGTPFAYFRKLINDHYPRYEVCTNVDPRTLGQTGGTAWTCHCGHRNYTGKCEQCGAPQPREYQPITFMMYRQGHQPALAIILCDKQRAPVRKTMELCRTMGIPCQCYYTHFRNSASYVVARMRDVLLFSGH